MSVWKKRTPSFLDAATSLEASAFSNGPFANYSGGSLPQTTLNALGDIASSATKSRRASKSGDNDVRALRPEWQEVKMRHYGTTTPLGFVLGELNGIGETTVSRPFLHYIGRYSGHLFEDYSIEQGDPIDLAEAVGGLFRRVARYEPTSLRERVGAGLWGLVPLVGDPILEGTGISDARDKYHSAESPTTTSAQCTGVVVGVTYWGRTSRIAQILAAARVRDAVQFDGSNSLLFGGGTSIYVGRRMPQRKRFLQAWGIQFRPVAQDQR
jgi:hypothetical protein